MVSRRWEPAIDGIRGVLARTAAANPGLRRIMAVCARELARASEVDNCLSDARWVGTDSTYGASYFGEGRDASGDRAGHSGYARYDRVASNADIAGWLLWRNFQVERVLDVGCATGFLVEVLRELGVEAEGCDMSPFAVAHAAPGAKGYIRVGNLFAGLPWEDGTFDLVSALEVLEHLPPDRVPIALAELRRVCGGYLYATIPSFGRNLSGPDGHFEGKVRPERLDHYRQLPPDYSGPVPEEDLAIDVDGNPIEGHVCIASFGWWTERFSEAGFTRCLDVERCLYADIAPADLAPYWNLYVFSVDGAPAEVVNPRYPSRTLAELGLGHPLVGS
ncbi:MAG: class I SAM-dependent methyltransferase [Acidimicrobiales bacterium]